MIRALAAAATSAVLSVGATPPVYSVTVRATLEERATYQLTGDAACFWTAHGIAVRHLDVSNTAPVRGTEAALERGVNVRLRVQEIRLANHSGIVGACPNLGPDVNDPTDGCGKRLYEVPARDVLVRLASARITVSFVRVAPDPFRGRCGQRLWGALPRPGGAAPAALLRFPPRPSSAALDLGRLRTGSTAAARWHGTVSTRRPEFGSTDVETSAWQVSLTRTS